MSIWDFWDALVKHFNISEYHDWNYTFLKLGISKADFYAFVRERYPNLDDETWGWIQGQFMQFDVDRLTPANLYSLTSAGFLKSDVLMRREKKRG